MTSLSELFEEVLVLRSEKGRLHLASATWTVAASIQAILEYAKIALMGAPSPSLLLRRLDSVENLCMKALIKGRAIDIDLAGGQKHLAAQLQSRGLGKRVESLATAALQFAEEATQDLQQKLVPPEQWPGMVVCRKHASADGTAWLMLRREQAGWKFDSALFD